MQNLRQQARGRAQLLLAISKWTVDRDGASAMEGVHMIPGHLHLRQPQQSPSRQALLSSAVLLAVLLSVSRQASCHDLTQDRWQHHWQSREGASLDVQARQLLSDSEDSKSGSGGSSSEASEPKKYSNARIHVSDGDFIAEDDMGVIHCYLNISRDTFASPDEPLPPGLPARSSFSLHVMLRYTVWANSVRIKGLVYTEHTFPEVKAVAGAKSNNPIFIEPSLFFQVRESKNAKPERPRAVHLRMLAPEAEADHSLNTYAFFTSFGVQDGWTHRYNLTATGSSSSCLINPLQEPNVVDYAGAQVPPISSDAAKEVWMVMSPFYNLPIEVMAVLLHHHLKYHTSIGVRKVVLYLRPETIFALAHHPRVAPWILSNHLLLVLWEKYPLRKDLPHFDQRLIFGHALLAFTGHSVLLAMVDLDEYLVSPQPQLQPNPPDDLMHLIKQCGQAPDVLILDRYHAAHRWVGSSWTATMRRTGGSVQGLTAFTRCMRVWVQGC